MASAETGSGKTAAFALPIVQLCHEQKTGSRTLVGTRRGSRNSPQFIMSSLDRDGSIAIDPQSQGLRIQSRDAKAWAGCRSETGVQGMGKYYYECKLLDEGIVRVGWSSSDSSLELGTDKGSYGYGGTGVKVNASKYDPFPDAESKTSFGKGDVVGCLLELASDECSISFSKNGVVLGKAFDLGATQISWFPAICVKNAECELNFGSADFLHLPDEFLAVNKAETTVTNPLVLLSLQTAMKDARGPMAIVIEPTRDLAEQTFRVFDDLVNRIHEPTVQSALLVGGVKPGKTLQLLQKDHVDILVGTPPIIASYMKKGTIGLQKCSMFVLDEADELITKDSLEHIQVIYSRLVAARGSPSRYDRLQVCFFSATLHSKEVRSLSERLCSQPLWVDLRGQNDSIVPDTVHHCIIPVESDQYDGGTGDDLVTDSVHRGGKLNDSIPWSKLDDKDRDSERVKQLKFKIVVRIMDELSMEQVLVFCRTNLDCDLMERYLKSLGGGGVTDKYRCRVLAGMRSMQERQKALKDFKKGLARVLICTDVAARGIDIRELPFVINVTLPDQPETYVHRVGRVGRAERMGLAISLVASNQERVWFCPKGKKPPQPDTRLLEEGGNTTWYDEPKYLKDIEKLMAQNKVGMTRLKWPELKIPAEIKALIDGGGYGNYVGGGTVDPEMEAKMKQLEPQVKAIGVTESALQSEFWKLRDRFRVKS
jgi:ATP-dependent RNA helicase DDX1